MDNDKQRRSLYGKAGAHRFKSQASGDAYDGMEYRVLSNFWVGSEERMRWAYRAVERAVEEFDILLGAAEQDKDLILHAINNSDDNTARLLVQKYGLEVANV